MKEKENSLRIRLRRTFPPFLEKKQHHKMLVKTNTKIEPDFLLTF
ncbi:MAG: hypothetical protein ABIK93_06065 [candidate division WOR-3 bacterium]